MSMHEDLGGDLQRSLSTSEEVTGGSESIVWPVWGGSERVDSRSAGIRRNVPKAVSLSLSILLTKYSANDLDRSLFLYVCLCLCMPRFLCVFCGSSCAIVLWTVLLVLEWRVTDKHTWPSHKPRLKSRAVLPTVNPSDCLSHAGTESKCYNDAVFTGG